MTTPFPKYSRYSPTQLAVIISHDSIREYRIPLTHITFMDRNKDCLLLPNQDDLRLGSGHSSIDEFNTALSKICDGFPVFDSENQYLIALRELLKYTMQDQYDYIGWWLYEAPDAGYTVWWDDEDGKEIRVDLTEPGALYDYLVEYAAPEGVQEDEL